MYECDECIFAGTTEADLQEHKKEMHNPNMRCNECGHTVLTEDDIRGHMRAYHENNADSDTQMIFLCDHCDDEFSIMSELEEHIKQYILRHWIFIFKSATIQGAPN